MWNLLPFNCKDCGQPKTMYYEDHELELRAADKAAIERGEGLLCWDCKERAIGLPPSGDRNPEKITKVEIKQLSPLEALEEQRAEQRIRSEIAGTLSIPLTVWDPDNPPIRLAASSSELAREEFKRFGEQLARRFTDGINAMVWAFQEEQRQRAFERDKERVILDLISITCRQVKRPSRRKFHDIERRIRRQAERMEIDEKFIYFYDATRHLINPII